MQSCDHPRKGLPLEVLHAQSKSLQGLLGNVLVGGVFAHPLDDFTHLVGSFFPYAADRIVTELQGNWKDIAKEGFRFIDMRDGGQLASYLLPHPELLRILLQNHENVDQIFSRRAVEDGQKFSEVRNDCQFEFI
jgi:hypothetical protein